MKGTVYRPEDPKRDSKIFKVAAVYSVCLSVLVFSMLFVGPISDSGCGCESAYEEERFPYIEVALVETPQDDHLMIKHRGGDPILWQRFAINIYNNSDLEQYTTLADLEGEITAGEGTIIKSLNNADLAKIDYEQGQAYKIEIIEKETGNILWQQSNIICF
jgi:hypothetical protein